MTPLRTSEQDLAEKLFTLCTQAEASFETQLNDALQVSHISAMSSTATIDHRELIIFFTWVAQRMVSEYPKIMNPLHATHFLSSIHPYFDGINDDQLYQEVTKRYAEYDQAMLPAPDPLDVIYISQTICPRVFGNDPGLVPHLPKIEIIFTRIVSEWVVSVMRTLKELF